MPEPFQAPTRIPRSPVLFLRSMPLHAVPAYLENNHVQIIKPAK